jgi:hypothetical protein
MNERQMLKLSVWLLAALFLLFGCEKWEYAHERSKQLWPSEEGFPDREIVFLVPHESENDIFGFIRPDGSGLITRTVASEYFTNLPTWSPDGQFIAFRAETLGSWVYFDNMRPRIISAKGKTVGWCHDWWKGPGRIWVTPEGQLLFSEEGWQEPDRVMLADYASCEVIETLYENSLSDGSDGILILDSAALSSQGQLAISRYYQEAHRIAAADVVLIDRETREERIIGHGLALAWSRDGEWLTYSGADGIYIVRKDGSESRRVIEIAASLNPEEEGLWTNDMPVAAWSPDGRWLIYSIARPHIADIYKVNLESGEVIKVFEGGLYPNWRWGLAPTD